MEGMGCTVVNEYFTYRQSSKSYPFKFVKDSPVFESIALVSKLLSDRYVAYSIFDKLRLCFECDVITFDDMILIVDSVLDRCFYFDLECTYQPWYMTCVPFRNNDSDQYDKSYIHLNIQFAHMCNCVLSVEQINLQIYFHFVKIFIALGISLVPALMRLLPHGSTEPDANVIEDALFGGRLGACGFDVLNCFKDGLFFQLVIDKSVAPIDDNTLVWCMPIEYVENILDSLRSWQVNSEVPDLNFCFAVLSGQCVAELIDQSKTVFGQIYPRVVIPKRFIVHIETIKKLALIGRKI